MVISAQLTESCTHCRGLAVLSIRQFRSSRILIMIVNLLTKSPLPRILHRLTSTVVWYREREALNVAKEIVALEEEGSGMTREELDIIWSATVNKPSKSKQPDEHSSLEDQIEHTKMNLRMLTAGMGALKRLHGEDDGPTDGAPSPVVPLTPILRKVHTLSEALLDGFIEKQNPAAQNAKKIEAAKKLYLLMEDTEIIRKMKLALETIESVADIFALTTRCAGNTDRLYKLRNHNKSASVHSVLIEEAWPYSQSANFNPSPTHTYRGVWHSDWKALEKAKQIVAQKEKQCLLSVKKGEIASAHTQRSPQSDTCEMLDIASYLAISSKQPEKLDKLSSLAEQIEQAKANLHNLSTGITALEKFQVQVHVGALDHEVAMIEQLQGWEDVAVSFTPLLQKVHVLAEALLDGLVERQQVQARMILKEDVKRLEVIESAKQIMEEGEKAELFDAYSQLKIDLATAEERAGFGADVKVLFEALRQCCNTSHYSHTCENFQTPHT
eukprot:1184861-Prorocentrum_minimum.AAC.1